MQTQNKRLLAYLAEHKYITALEAINELGIYRLASRICDLRHIGYKIASEMITVKNRFDEDCRVKRYWIVGKAAIQTQSNQRVCGEVKRTNNRCQMAG